MGGLTTATAESVGVSDGLPASSRPGPPGGVSQKRKWVPATCVTLQRSGTPAVTAAETTGEHDGVSPQRAGVSSPRLAAPLGPRRLWSCRPHAQILARRPLAWAVHSQSPLLTGRPPTHADTDRG